MSDITNLANFDTRSQVVVAKLLTLMELIEEFKTALKVITDHPDQYVNTCLGHIDAITSKFLTEFNHRIHSVSLIATALHTDLAKELETEVRHAEAAIDQSMKHSMDDEPF